MRPNPFSFILVLRTFFISLCAMLLSFRAMAQVIIPLDGAWDFRMGDPDGYSDEAVSVKKGLVLPAVYDDYVMLPGSMLTNGKGLPVSVSTQWTGSLYDSSYYFNPYMEKYRHEGQMKFPFFLTPERHYVGAAWYRRTIYVPRHWKDQRITLFLERPHIETTVYVNGRRVGHQLSLSTPHRYDVTDLIDMGKTNEIAIRVYNGIENVCVGQDSHSVTDQTQGNWNGIVGRMELQARPKHVNIERVRVYPNVEQAKARVVVDLDNNANRLLGSAHVFQIKEYGLTYELRYDGQPDSLKSLIRPRYYWDELNGRQQLSFDIDFHVIKKMQLWDEFSPVLYRLIVYAGDDSYETTFGMRDIRVQGRQLMINGRPLFLRGTVENCCFPETGYPPTDEAEWTRIFRKCKEYGLNHMRFHSYCPPEAAFRAADRMGIYLQPEGPSWPNHGVKLRRGQKIDDYLLEESKRIVDEYGHHPSFVMMAAGNEPAGDWVSYCNDWVSEMKAYDPTKIYAGASVGGGWAWDSGSEYHVKGGARGLDPWNSHAPSSDDDYYSGIEFPRNYKGDSANQQPIVTHEKGQWCAFPDFSEIPQYTGVYKARNFEIFQDLLRLNGMDGLGPQFLHASGQLQTLCYKYEIERNLRTKDYAGFQLLALNDYSGQGTALVGPLNVHWREKGYVTAPQWREFCSVLVSLARFPKFVYTNSDTLRVPVEAYNAFSIPLTDVNATYYITIDDASAGTTTTGDSARVIAGGVLSRADLPIGKNIPLGTVVMPLDTISTPAKLTLHVQFTPQLRNHWDFWVYPDDKNSETADETTGKRHEKLLITADYHAALKALKSGKTVLLTAAGKVTLGSDVKQSYLPVFWNTSWFKMRPPHTTGAYIRKEHPLFKHNFPTDDWSNLNWWELLNKAQVMNLRELPATYQSPVQPIDTWHVSRKLGMIVEARVDKGRLLMTTIDIATDLARRPVARQLRRAIVSYMTSPDFQPQLTLEPAVVEHFFTTTAPKVDMFTKESPDELKPALKP